MVIIADDLSFANRVFPEAEWCSVALSELQKTQGRRFLAEQLFEDPHAVFRTEISQKEWQAAFLAGHSRRSQFDILIEGCSSQVQLPDRIYCLAGSGQGFHGQRGRPWKAERGNLHLSVMLQPRTVIPRFHVAFPLLAAVSLLQTLDGMEALTLRAGVKWVNDIFIDGAKIAGFITHVQSQEQEVKSVVLGIGMNVATLPLVAADAFVPRVAALDNFLAQGKTRSLRQVLSELLSHVDRNYRLILEDEVDPLLDFYRERSLVLGRRVRVISDPVSAESRELMSGRVVGIGENLELFLEGRSDPVTQGRLILEE